MRKLILLIALAVGAWHMFNQSQQESIPAADVEESVSDSKVSAFEMQHKLSNAMAERTVRK